MASSGKRKKSIFTQFIEDGTKDMIAARELYNKAQKSYGKEKDALEERKIFLMASASEKFSKGLYAVYSGVILFPVLFLFPVKRLEIRNPRAFQNLGNKIKELFKRAEDPKKIGHRAITRSGLKEILHFTIELLPKDTAKEFKLLYRKIIDYNKAEK